MTRETRIGLLVGLAFIIMFGLVLTELTGTGSTTDSAQAPPPDSSALVWSPQAEDVSPTVVQPGSPEIPTAEQTAPAPPPIPLAAQYQPITAADEPPALGADTKPIADFVEPLQPVVELTRAIKPPPAQPGEPALANYTVRPGDTLYGIASRHYGSANARQYRLIAEANRKALGSKDLLRIGQVLVIPPLPQAARPPAGARPVEVSLEQLREQLDSMGLSAVGAANATKPPTTAAAPTVRTYTVKRGDSLTKIAALALKDGRRAAVMRIYQANRDKLKSPNALKEGMTLTIPQ